MPDRLKLLDRTRLSRRLFSLAAAMARENVILPKTLRETLGDAVGDESINFGEALAHADGMKPHFHAGLPHGHVGQEGLSQIADLPAAPMNVHAGTKISYFGDLLMNQAYGEITGTDGKTVGVLTDWKDPQGQPCRLDVVKDLATKSNFSGLPPPFNLKSQPGGPYVMQIFVVGAGDGKVNIFKDVDLRGQFLKMANCEPMCHGTGVVYQYGNQYRAGRNAICYLLEKLGGLQIRFSTLTATAKPAKRTTEWDKKQEGYRYIEKKGPKSNNRNQFMEFADKDSRAEEHGATWLAALPPLPPTPIFGRAGLLTAERLRLAKQCRCSPAPRRSTTRSRKSTAGRSPAWSRRCGTTRAGASTPSASLSGCSR